MVERNTAYGMSAVAKEGAPGHYVITLMALKDRTIEVWLDEAGVLHAICTVGGEPCELLSVYVETKSNWMGMPTVVHVDLKAVKASGEATTERIKK